MSSYLWPNDIGTFDVAMCRLMGFNPHRINHIKYMINKGSAPSALEQIDMNCDPVIFKPCEFILKRTIQNYLALAGFHSSAITWFGYDSFAANFLQKILYTFKPNLLKKEVQDRKIEINNLSRDSPS